MRLLPLVAAATAAFLVVACSSPTPPRGVTVVNNFDAKRYLGTWYEIARFDHRFERGLEKVTATYSLRDDGGLNVINKGYNPDREMWQQSVCCGDFFQSTFKTVIKTGNLIPGTEITFGVEIIHYCYATRRRRRTAGNDQKCSCRCGNEREQAHKCFLTGFFLSVDDSKEKRRKGPKIRTR